MLGEFHDKSENLKAISKKHSVPDANEIVLIVYDFVKNAESCKKISRKWKHEKGLKNFRVYWGFYELN